MDVVEVVFNSAAHHVVCLGDASQSVYLCPAGEAGFDSVALHVLAYDLVVVGVLVCYVRSGANNGHAPLQDVEELG